MPFRWTPNKVMIVLMCFIIGMWCGSCEADCAFDHKGCDSIPWRR